MTTISHLPVGHGDAAELESLLDALAGVAVRGAAPGPELLARVAHVRAVLAALASDPNDGEPYSRTILRIDEEVEIMLARWRPGQRCAPHDHGGAGGFVIVLEGRFEERRFGWDGSELIVAGSAEYLAGAATRITSDVIHDMAGLDGGLTLHFYSPPATSMRVFDLDHSEMLELVGNYGAWIPAGQHPRVPFARVSPEMIAAPVIWVAHTTHYRGGSEEFAVAAATMARELAAAHPDAEVKVVGPASQGGVRRRAHPFGRGRPRDRPAAPHQPFRNVRPDVRIDRLARTVLTARMAFHGNPFHRLWSGTLPRVPHRALVRAVLRECVRSTCFRQPRLHHGVGTPRQIPLGGPPAGLPRRPLSDRRAGP
ncbi:hypothetical protein [Mycolicibacterium setense]